MKNQIEQDLLNRKPAAKARKLNKSEEASKKGKAIKKKSTQLVESDESSENEDCFCVVCCDSFSNSASKEKWIKCVQCSNWAHVKCTDASSFFLFQHCDSD